MVIKIKKNIQSTYQKNVSKKKHVDLLLIGEREKNTMFLSMISIDSYTIIHYIERKHSYCCCLHAFNTEEISKCHIKDCLKLMLNKQVRCVKKMNIISSKSLKEK